MADINLRPVVKIRIEKFCTEKYFYSFIIKII